MSALSITGKICKRARGEPFCEVEWTGKSKNEERGPSPLTTA